MDYRIIPPEEIIETTVKLPYSKSVAARDLMMDFISGTPLTVPANMGDDVEVLYDILSKGFKESEVDVHGSGTALRFLCALLAATPGTDCRITGNDSLRARPVGPLVDALKALGADIEYTVRQGYPPLRIRGKRLGGGTIGIPVNDSTQYCSALMLAAPLMEAPLTLELSGRSELPPYIKMTADMMTARGVTVEADPLTVKISGGNYTKAAGMPEGDWSSASFWYEITAVSAGWVTLENLQKKSLQPDSTAAALFNRLGANTEWTEEGAELSAMPEIFSRLDADLSGCPDLVPPLVVTSVLTGVPFKLDGVAALRHKESDRLAVLRDEMEKLGVSLIIENYDNTLRWDGKRMPIVELPTFSSHGDHRIAMSLAAVSIFLPGIVITGAECVEKSYPGFWDDLRSAGFTLLDPSEPFNLQEE